MRMTKMTDCCGISVLHHLDQGLGFYDLWDSTARRARIMKQLYKYLKKAKYKDNRAYVISNYASVQPQDIKECMEEIGFKKVKGPVVNPNTGNKITTYLFDLANFEKISPL